MNNETIVYTPGAILDLLSQIEELSDYDLNLIEAEDGSIDLQVGDSVYSISSSNAEEVAVEEEVVDEIEEINQDALENADDGLDTVESGLLKEAAKALLLGGMIKLSTKLLK